MMPLTIVAENLYDAAEKLGLRDKHAPIKIEWRSGDFGYRMAHEVGCIVDAVGMPGQEVKRVFTTSREAVRYIAGLLKLHDDAARKHKADEAKREREQAKKKAKCDGR
jgi:hypothetical protein